MSKFEYKVLTIDINPGFAKPKINDDLIRQNINALGKDGWELVSVVPNAGGYGHLYSHTLYFKKLLINPFNGEKRCI